MATQSAEKESRNAEDCRAGTQAQLSSPARSGSAHWCQLVLALQGLLYPVYPSVGHLSNSQTPTTKDNGELTLCTIPLHLSPLNV